MIHWYERAFKLINPKLYASSYNKNVIQVYDMLKCFSIKAQLNFILNLRNVDIDEMSYTDMMLNPFIGGYVRENKIKISPRIIQQSPTKTDTVVNHELIHTSGSVNNGSATKEGITEYLNMKSRNKEEPYKVQHTYKESVFVVQILVYLFGEGWLNTYFENGDVLSSFGKGVFSRKLYDNKVMFSKSINNIILLLNRIYRVNKTFSSILRYFVLSDIAPKFLQDDEEFLKKLTLNKGTEDLIKKKINYQELNLKKYFLKEFIFSRAECLDYVYNKMPSNKRIIFENLMQLYRERQSSYLREIMEIFLSIAERKKISKQEFSDYIREVISYKGEFFKQTYNNTIDDVLRENIKKR